MPTVRITRRALWLLVATVVIAGLAVAGELRSGRAGAQEPSIQSVSPESHDACRVPSVIGSIGASCAA